MLGKFAHAVWLARMGVMMNIPKMIKRRGFIISRELAVCASGSSSSIGRS